MRIYARAAVVLLLAGAGGAGQAVRPHPHFDDGGVLPWYTKLAEAQAAARKQGKLVFIEYGREAWGNCRALVERVLKDEEVKKRIRGLAVGLAADCDAPERDVQEIMRANLAGARTLPFVGFVTHKGQWVGGFSGYRDTGAFLKVLKDAEKTPYLQASKAVRKKLAGLAAKAKQAAAKGQWKSVMRCAQAAAKTTGRCPERDALAAVVGQARAWAAGRLDAAVRMARAGGDLTPARKVLSEVKQKFSGEPEAAEAALGLKALGRLAQIVRLEAGGAPLAEAREKECRKYKDTRWASVFRPPEPKEESDQG